jgi:hypothetical protein
VVQFETWKKFNGSWERGRPRPHGAQFVDLLCRNQFSRCALIAGETPALPGTVAFSNPRFETEPVLDIPNLFAPLLAVAYNSQFPN